MHPQPHQHQSLQAPKPAGSPQPLPTAARQETHAVRLSEDYGQTERHRLPDRIVPTAGRQASRTPGTARYGGGFSNKADWRRSNVNVLIKKIHETVREVKPWVKFGVSPFGIYAAPHSRRFRLGHFLQR